jgi:hypothetical protein
MPNEQAIYDEGTEHLIVLQMLEDGHPVGRPRAELEDVLCDLDPDVIGNALRSLEAAGVVHLEDEDVQPSLCARRLDTLGLIAV